MDRFCCVSGCDNRAIRDKLDGKGQTIGYFHFPPEKEARRRAIRIHGDPGPPDHHFSTSREKCICSMHFEEELAIPAMTTTELPLTKEAIPTVFSASGISDGDTSTAVQTANDNQRDMSEDVGESDDPNDSANDGRNPWNSPPRARTPPRLGYSLPKMDATQGAYAKPYKPYDIFAEDDDDEDYLLIPNRHTAMNSSRLDELLSAPAVAHSRWDD